MRARCQRLCVVVLAFTLVHAGPVGRARGASQHSGVTDTPKAWSGVFRAGQKHTEGSPFFVRPGVSLALSLGALGLAGLLEGAVRPALTSSLLCAKSPEGACLATKLNAVDRAALGYQSALWGELSDVGQIVLPVVGALTLGLDAFFVSRGETFWHSGVTSNLLVGLEAVSLATAATTLIKYAVRRPRPRQYIAPPRAGVDGDLSFPSGHTTLAAAVSVVTATTLTLSHPDARVRAGAWALAGVFTATMATSRVLAGKHFPSDVTAGAIVGGVVGALVPLLHRMPLRVAPILGSTGFVGMVLEGPLGGRKGHLT